MKLYTINHPECEQACQKIRGEEWEFISLDSSSDMLTTLRIREDFFPAIFLLPLYYEKDNTVLLDLLGFAEQNDIPVLFVCKRFLKKNNHWVVPKSIAFETVTLSAHENEWQIKLQGLKNIGFQLYSSKIKAQELELMQKKMDDNLHLAKNIQQLVLPSSIKNEDLEIEGIFQPSSQLSGDLYFWMKTSEGEYGLILIDVCGKGIHAALISMSMRSLMPGLLKRVRDPKLIAEELNSHMDRLFRNLNKMKSQTAYFTAFIVYAHIKERRIEYVNAGHPPGLLYSPNSKELHYFSKGSLPIGLVPNLDVEKGIVHYEENSTFLLYTDGLTESPNHPDILRLKDVEDEFIAGNQKKKTSVLLEEMLVSRMKHSQIKDDICIIMGTLF